MADSGYRLGIDFGTSNTVAVLRWPDGRSKALLFDGAPLLPSAVYVAEDGSILTGRDAVHSARLHPHRFEPYPKRRIDETAVYLGEREIPTTELIATVLRRVNTEALRVANTQPSAITLTHPAAWGALRRDTLTRAAIAAGLPAPMLVPEPVAAASYFVGTVGTHLPINGAAVVYDFGAGTFDATVVRRTAAGGFDVLSAEGLTDAGGLDVDAAIVTFLGTQLASRAPDEWHRLSQPADDTDRRAAWQLWEDARQAKETLSRAANTYVHVPLIDDSVPLGREQLELLARSILDRTVTATLLAVSAAGLTPAQLSAVFLVGGSSRIPLAATLLHRGFGTAPTAIEQPELVVAEGALQLAPRAGRAIVGPGPGPTASSPLGDLPGGPMSGPGASPGSPATPVSGPPVSGPPVFGRSVSGPPVSGPGYGPSVSGPGYGQPGTTPPVSGPPVVGPPVVGPPVVGPPVLGAQSAPVTAVPGSNQQVPQPGNTPQSPSFSMPSVAGPQPGTYPPPPAPPAGWPTPQTPPSYGQPAPGQPGVAASGPPGYGPTTTSGQPGYPQQGPAQTGPASGPAFPPPAQPGHPQPAQPGYPQPATPGYLPRPVSTPPISQVSVPPPVSVPPQTQSMPSPGMPAPQFPPPPPNNSGGRRGALIGGLAAAVVLLLAVVTTVVVLANRDGKKKGKKQPPVTVAAACGYKIAYLGVLTDASDGVTIRNAAELAVNRYNEKHPGCTASLEVYDTKGDDDEAVRLAGEIVKDEKILGVVGPVWYSEALEVLPVLDAAGLSTISPSLPYAKLSQSGWKTFHRTVGNDIDQARAAARYLTSVMYAQRVFIVADNDEPGITFSQELRLRLNTAYAGRADIRGDEKDYASVLSQISAANADAVFFAGYYDAGGVFVKQLRAANTGIKIAGWDRVFTDDFINGAGKGAAEGVVITCPCLPPSEARDNFASDFRAKYTEAGYFSPEAFDAANAFLAGLDAGKATRADMVAYLATYDRPGVSRQVKFTSSGDLELNSPTVWAYKIRDGGVYKDQAVNG